MDRKWQYIVNYLYSRNWNVREINNLGSMIRFLLNTGLTPNTQVSKKVFIQAAGMIKVNPGRLTSVSSEIYFKMVG